jgi:hypothetical protein
MKIYSSNFQHVYNPKLNKTTKGEKTKKNMVMGVLKYASKWITTTTKGKELKMEFLCVIYMSVPKQTQNTK